MLDELIGPADALDRSGQAAYVEVFDDGSAKAIGQQLGDIHGRHVLLIDDILDSGGTIKTVVPILHELGRGIGQIAVGLQER